MAIHGRTMLIVWKWVDLTNQNPIDLSFPVKSYPADKIIRLNERYSAEAIQRLALIIEVEGALGHRIQVFLHREHGYTPAIMEELSQKFSNQFPKPKIHIFGHGADFLYYSHNGRGLLDEFGSFMADPEFPLERKDADGNTIRVPGSAYVIEWNAALSRWELMPGYFDQVWNHYDLKVWEHFFHLKEDLFRQLLVGQDLNVIHRMSDPHNYEILACMCEQAPIIWKRIQTLFSEISPKIFPLQEPFTELLPLRNEFNRLLAAIK